MGIDKSLWDAYPSVIINGSKYHYGRTREYGSYLVENANIAKDYWAFKEKEDLQAFLINLPESGDRNLRRKLHPDWTEATPEQRDAYFEQDKLLFRSWAQEKVNNGTAQSFNMDLEGEHGPYHEPQRVQPKSEQEAPLQRVERQLADWKSAHAAPKRDPALSDAVNGLLNQSFDSDLSDAGKLRVLEGLDWSGIDDQQKETLLTREVNFSKITRDQLDFVYEDIASDKFEEVDERPGRRLFDNANFERARHDTGDFSQQLQKVRDTTRNLIESVMLDTWPRNAAVIDFGLDSQKHYEALYYPIREMEIMPAALDAALGHGKNLTALAREAPSNPHKDVQFHTSWDGIFNRPKPDGAMSEADKLERTLSQLSGDGYEKALEESAKRGGSKDKDKAPTR